MTRHHEISMGEMHALDYDQAGDEQQSIETWVKCSCGWEDGTWASDVVAPVMLREGDDAIAFVRRNRDAAVDRHIYEAHRFSMMSSWQPETDGNRAVTSAAFGT